LGSALLVDGNKQQWRTIRGDRPFTFRDGIRYLEVPPPPVTVKFIPAV
jgi:hypothetical protein